MKLFEQLVEVKFKNVIDYLGFVILFPLIQLPLKFVWMFSFLKLHHPVIKTIIPSLYFKQISNNIYKQFCPNPSWITNYEFYAY